MNPDQSHQEQITTEEKVLLEAIRQNPALKDSIGDLLQRFNLEVGQGMDELEAESLITQMTRKIGANLVQDWATHSQQDAVNESLQSPQIIKRGQKNDTGIAPLE